MKLEFSRFENPKIYSLCSWLPHQGKIWGNFIKPVLYTNRLTDFLSTTTNRVDQLRVKYNKHDNITRQ
jgi:hypothetical protein